VGFEHVGVSMKSLVGGFSSQQPTQSAVVGVMRDRVEERPGLSVFCLSLTVAYNARRKQITMGLRLFAVRHLCTADLVMLFDDRVGKLSLS
jgi:hypothetical protein